MSFLISNPNVMRVAPFAAFAMAGVVSGCSPKTEKISLGQGVEANFEPIEECTSYYGTHQKDIPRLSCDRKEREFGYSYFRVSGTNLGSTTRTTHGRCANRVLDIDRQELGVVANRNYSIKLRGFKYESLLQGDFEFIIDDSIALQAPQGTPVRVTLDKKKNVGVAQFESVTIDNPDITDDDGTNAFEVHLATRMNCQKDTGTLFVSAANLLQDVANGEYLYVGDYQYSGDVELQFERYDPSEPFTLKKALADSYRKTDEMDPTIEIVELRGDIDDRFGRDSDNGELDPKTARLLEDKTLGDLVLQKGVHVELNGWRWSDLDLSVGNKIDIDCKESKVILDGVSFTGHVVLKVVESESSPKFEIVKGVSDGVFDVAGLKVSQVHQDWMMGDGLTRRLTVRLFEPQNINGVVFGETDELVVEMKDKKILRAQGSLHEPTSFLVDGAYLRIEGVVEVDFRGEQPSLWGGGSYRLVQSAWVKGFKIDQGRITVEYGKLTSATLVGTQQKGDYFFYGDVSWYRESGALKRANFKKESRVVDQKSYYKSWQLSCDDEKVCREIPTNRGYDS